MHKSLKWADIEIPQYLLNGISGVYSDNESINEGSSLVYMLFISLLID